MFTTWTGKRQRKTAHFIGFQSGRIRNRKNVTEMKPIGGRGRAMVFLPECRAFPVESYTLDRLLGENKVLVNRMNRKMDSTNQEQPASSPSQQYCAFCFHAKLPNVEFYKHIVGSSVELRKSFQTLLGYDFRLEDFAICKPCWKIMQLMQDFRLRCLRANRLAERRSGQGLRRSEDSWFSARNLATIENIRMVVKDQLQQIEKMHIGGVVSKVSAVQRGEKDSTCAKNSRGAFETIMEVCEVKMEPGDANGSTDAGKNLNQIHTPKSPLNVDKIKVEPDVAISNTGEKKIECINLDSEESDTAEAGSHEQSSLKAGDVKVEPDYLILSVELEQPSSPSKHLETETESDDWEDENSDTSNKANESGLFECKKCHRMFESTGFKLHVPICDGKRPARIYSCPECPITFSKHHKLVAHKNKHAGITPYQCRKNCERGFASAAVRNRHEIRCGIDIQKCMFCDKLLDNRLRLYEHYRLVHPGEPKFSCSQCEKRFKRKEHLQAHEKRMHSSERSRDLACEVCEKTFAEKQNLQAHMKVHSDERPFQCDQCGKQLKAKHSLDLHMACKHPELASEYGLKALARMQERYKEVSNKRKLENRVLKKRGRKPKKQKQESSESEDESSEDYTEESDSE